MLWKFKLDFGGKKLFSKTRIDHVMLKFRAITENQKLIESEDLNCDRGKVDKNH